MPSPGLQPRERAPLRAFAARTVEQNASPGLVVLHMGAGGQPGTAPGTGEHLQHPGVLVAGTLAGAGDLLLGLVEPVGRDGRSHPQADTERLGAPARVVREFLAAQHLARGHERSRALELLGGQQPQGVAHENADPAFPAAGLGSSTEGALQPSQGEGVRGQPEIGLGLATTGREEEQVDERLAPGSPVGMTRPAE